MVDLLRIGVEDRLEWFRAENIAGSGMLRLISGELETARDQLEEVAALATARDQRDLEPSWFIPWDPVVAELTLLAEARWMLGDLAGADAGVGGRPGLGPRNWVSHRARSASVTKSSWRSGWRSRPTGSSALPNWRRR